MTISTLSLPVGAVVVEAALADELVNGKQA
jgi:hypothetical protein